LKGLTRKERGLLKSTKAKREIMKRQKLAEAALQAINSLPFLSRVKFCWAVITKRV